MPTTSAVLNVSPPIFAAGRTGLPGQTYQWNNGGV